MWGALNLRRCLATDILITPAMFPAVIHRPSQVLSLLLSIERRGDRLNMSLLPLPVTTELEIGTTESERADWHRRLMPSDEPSDVGSAEPSSMPSNGPFDCLSDVPSGDPSSTPSVEPSSVD